MDQDLALSQEAIDALFQAGAPRKSEKKGAPHARNFNFRRTDRIPKELIRALRAVHDTFARSLASSLSAYLRTYVTVNLVSVEQVSFLEFSNSLASPTCLTSLTLEPFEALGVLEISPALAFPLIEILLGGGKVKPIVVNREMTSIETQILDTLLALILQNLSLAWQSVAKVAFAVERHETEPSMLRILPPNEAIVVISTEIQLGGTSGVMVIGIPAALVKTLRQRFEEQWNVRKHGIVEGEESKMLAQVDAASVRIEALVRGATLSFADLLRLQAGDVLVLDRDVNEPVQIVVNGSPKFVGHLTAPGNKRAVALDEHRNIHPK